MLQAQTDDDGAGIGIYNVVTYDSDVIRAFNPYWWVTILLFFTCLLQQWLSCRGYLYFSRNGLTSFKALGGGDAFTGVDALYADMVHFGKRPFRAGWLFIVFPSVTMSSFGQARHLSLKYTICISSIPPIADLYHPPSLHDWASVLRQHSLRILLALDRHCHDGVGDRFSIAHQQHLLAHLTVHRISVEHTSDRLHGQVYSPVTGS